MKVYYSEAWGGWVARIVINGEMFTIIDHDKKRAQEKLQALIAKLTSTTYNPEIHGL